MEVREFELGGAWCPTVIHYRSKYTITPPFWCMRAAHPGGTIVCVSHADPIKAAVAHALGTHLDLFQRIVISTCAISVLAFTRGGPAVLAVNSTGGSLKELRPS